MTAVVKSADRTLAILDLLSDHHDGLTLIEIQRLLAFPKSSTHSLLTTMVARGFLEQDHDSRRFRAGIRLWQAGQSYLAVTDLENVALPYMEALRDTLNETVQLATLDGTDIVYIAKVESDQQLRLASRVGTRLPAYATGLGKALLSQLDDAEVRNRFRGVEFIRFTPRTITSVTKLIAELRAIRTRGYASDFAEHTPGVLCFATALHGNLGGTRAAISVSIPDVRRDEALIERTIDYVRSTAREVSQRMGHRPTPSTSTT